MRRSPLVLGTLLLLPSLLRAGIHNPAESPLVVEKDLNTFLSQQLGGLRGLGPPDPLSGAPASRSREGYLLKVQALRDKQMRGRLTAEEHASLGAYLIRLRRTRQGTPDLEEAVEVLVMARHEHPRNFFILANLGTAYQLTGRLDVAEGCLLEAEALAPDEHRIFERFQLRLLRLRLREQLTLGLAPLDQLFTNDRGSPVRFVGEQGAWQVGQLAAAELAKLPGGSLDEAIRIVQQLLIWLPDDARLHWLLGELANARGDLRAAARAMNAAVYDFRLSTPELKQRRVLLNEAAAWQGYFERVGDSARQQAWLLDALGVHLQLTTAAPDLGQVALGQEQLTRRITAGTVGGLKDPGAEGATALAAWQELGWKAYAIAGAGAAMVLLFLLSQMRQALRRKRGVNGR